MRFIILVIGITMTISGFKSNSLAALTVGIVMTVVGLIFFWQKSETKAYLDNNKRNR